MCGGLLGGGDMIEVFREGLKVFREEGFKAFVKKSFLYVTRKLLGLNGLKYVLIPHYPTLISDASLRIIAVAY